jgi:hypothetical protein
VSAGRTSAGGPRASGTNAGATGTGGEAGVKKRRTSRAGVVLSLVAAAKIVLLWASDVIFAPPIIALTAQFGLAWGFAISAVVYSAGSYVGALWVVRVMGRRVGARETRVQRLVDRERHATRGRWATGAIGAGSWLGLAMSGILVGGIITTALYSYAGLPRDIRVVAAFTSIVFGVTFAGFYAFNASLVF